ncbi:MAG: tetratricopeptide repeat protein [Capnocytophaga sp.]|nr:tetratricopeptide repeat protein [Capnocytophaga sp.]
MHKKILYISLAVLLLGLVFWFALRRMPADAYQPLPSATTSQTATYIGVESCRECHAEAFDQWQQSHHFRAMEVADTTSVLGDFDQATYTADGITSRFFTENGNYFIHTQGEDGVYRDYEVLYTFGFYPLQQYLIAFGGGRMQVARQSWDSRDKKWFHQYEKQHIPHDDWLHWTGNAQNWNMMCAACHSTDLQKNYDPKTDTYQTTYSHITVSCESCHGPASLHLADVNAPNTMWDIYSQQAEIVSCVPCHSRRGEIGSPWIDSHEFLDNFIPEIPATPNYFADGQVLEENYKYASFLQSRMYVHGVRCTDCHKPHSAKLKLEGNALCLQCHAGEKYDTQTHTFHSKEGQGGSCINCHMPTRTYMGNDIRHDHVFRIPRPDLTEKYGVPNTCNQCHTDKTATWASQTVKKWYGNTVKPYHFDEDLIKGSLGQADSEASLLKLIAGTYPDMVKATALHYLGEQPSASGLEALLASLTHANAQVRYQAVVSLINFSPQEYGNQLAPLLSDKVRAVRIATANVLLTHYGTEAFATIPRLEKAVGELEKFILHQSDFATGSAAAGDFYVKMGQTDKALLFYERALQKDKQLTYVRQNRATLYSRLGQNDKAMAELEAAMQAEPDNGAYVFRAALLSYEMSQPGQSAQYFQKAVRLLPDNPRLRYNYGLFLQHQGKIKDAEYQYLEGLKRDSGHRELRYALYVLYAQQGDFAKAEKYK